MEFRFLMILIVVTNISVAVCSSSTQQMKTNANNLNGVHLKFAATHFPPYNVLTLMSDGNYTDTGSNSFYFAWLAEKLNFTVSYYYLTNKVTETKYGNMSDIAILLSLISEKKVDGSSRFIIENPERKQLANFAYFMWAEPFAMVVPRPGEQPRLFAFVQPFQPMVWLLIFIGMFAIVTVLTQFTEVYSKLSIAIDSASASSFVRRITMFERTIDYSTYVISIITNQGNIIHVKRLSFRILIGAWVLVATVLVNSYSGIVISYMTVPKMKPAINTFEDLVLTSKDVKLILLADTMTKKRIMEAESGDMKILGDQIRGNPERILNNLEKVIVQLKTERYALPNPQSFCNNFVASQFQEKGQCRFKTTDALSMNIFFSLPLQKDSKYSPIFKQALVQLWETGLPQHWVKNSIVRAPKCFEKSNQRKSTKIPKPIKLDDLTGAFLIWGIGFGLATFSFLMEKIVSFKGNRNRMVTIG